jgi:hypothetical protein
MNRPPQFRQSFFSHITKQNISISRAIHIFIYYAIAKHIPSGGDGFRGYLASRIFKSFGKQASVRKGVIFGSGINIELGSYSSLNTNCWIANDTVIGEDVMIPQTPNPKPQTPNPKPLTNYINNL